MNKERKIFWAAMVLILAGLCSIPLLRHFSTQKKEIVPIAGFQTQMQLLRRQKRIQADLISKPSTPAIVVSTVPVVAELADENEKFLQKFDSKLLQNSEIEDFIRDRLWLALDRLNNPLMQKLNLSSDEIVEFKNLAVSNLVAATELAGMTVQDSKTFESDVDAALELRREIFESQLHQLLGDTRFAQYQNGIEDYSQFYGIKFLDGSLSPLPNARVEQIVSAMQSERQTVNSAAAQIQAENGAPLSAADQLQVRELIFARTYDQVQNFLAPEQLTAFGKFELQQLDLFRTKVTSQ